MKKLEEIRVDVCVKPQEDYKSIQLHVFADASKIAYCACAYVRVEYPDHIRVTLVTSKGRISPRKPMSIIKMEVQAAVIGSRMLQSAIRAFDEINFTSTHLWSDSKSYLHMLNNDSKRFEVWFSVRLAEIHESTNLADWNYCPTKLNVADLLSRGVMPGDEKRSKEFYNGPSFLKLPPTEWPTQAQEDTSETIAVSHLYATSKEKDSETETGLERMIKYYDNLFKLKRKSG